MGEIKTHKFPILPIQIGSNCNSTGPGHFWTFWHLVINILGSVKVQYLNLLKYEADWKICIASHHAGNLLQIVAHFWSMMWHFYKKSHNVQNAAMKIPILCV